MRKSRFLLFLAILLCLSLACNLLTARNTPTPSSNQPTEPALQLTPVQTLKPATLEPGTNATPVQPAGSQGTIDGLVQGALAQHSVKINLTTTRPDGQGFQLQGEIDAAGSQHLIKTYSASPTALFTNGVKNPPAKTELYVLKGAAYAPDENGALQPAEAKDTADYLQATLLGPDGPGFWLKILPSGSLSPAGSEDYGGFKAQKYTIQGTLEGAAITGSLWVEPSSPALLGAEIDVPASLAGPQTTGSLHIQFKVEKATVAPIQPKIAVATTATSTPVTGAQPTLVGQGTSGLPADVPLYQDAKVMVEQPGMIMYQSAASVEMIKQFYQNQLKANGWEVDGEPMENGGVYIAGWKKGDLTIQITLTPNNPSGSMVVITCDGCK